MPLAVPSGSVRRVVAVEESELKGYDGILVLEPAGAAGNRA
jgi:hypothetical protein